MEKEGPGGGREIQRDDLREMKKKEVFQRGSGVVHGVDAIRGQNKVRLKNGSGSMSEC